MLASTVVGAQFVATTSARDALFLSGFSARALPMMVIASSAISILLVVLASRGFRRVAPSTYVPLIFAMSALLVLAEWALARVAPGTIARIFYLHTTGLGPMLGSGLWLVMSERFDPRTAKKSFGQIGGVQTLGGVIGGLLAAPVAARAGIRDMLLLVAVLQALCAWFVHGLARPVALAAPVRAPKPDAEVRSAWRVLADAPYLRTLAVLMLVVTIAAAFIDYVFKVQVTASINRGTDLGTFFSLYYAALNVITFAVQTFGSQAVIEKLGLAAVAGAPSLVLTVGSAFAMAVPGLWSVAAAHGGERVTHGSLFRTGYEQFYTPVAPGDRRAVKSMIDVGVARAGDMTGAAVVLVLQDVGARSPILLLLACGIGCSVVALAAARSLTRGYVTTLEESLLHRAVEIDLSDAEDLTTRTIVLRTIRQHPAAPQALPMGDSSAREIAALHSRNPEAVRRVLADPKGLRAELAPHVIALLAWDAIAQDAIRALRAVAEERVGQLVDALVDPNQPFAVRRRLARVFSVCVSQRAADGVTLGLDDLRFEVRFHSGRSLAAIVEKNPRVRIDRDAILEAVRREVNVSRSVWEGRQLLDALPGAEEEEQSPAERVVSQRASQSLAHVFTLLSLVLPTEAIRVSYNALYCGDDRARGTALEYLDAVLPPDIKERLWPFLEARRRRPPSEPRRREEILADLLQANESIVLNLKTLESESASQRPPAPKPQRPRT